MGWDEWAAHDAVALAERVRRGELTRGRAGGPGRGRRRQAQPAAERRGRGLRRRLADPLKAGARADGFFAGVPFLMKDLGPTLQGRLQEMGSLFMRGNRAAEDSFLTGRCARRG